MKIYIIILYLSSIRNSSAYTAARSLFDDLFNKAQNYPKLLPVINLETPIIVYMNLSLSQILEVNVKDQIIVLNVWVYQEWNDNRFVWNPSDYGGLTEIQIPSNMIWLPDLVLYNNAGGDWDLSGMSGSKVKVKHDGTIIWKPPVILKSQCEMDVTYFPFDIQTCPLKMGTWTHNGLLIDLRHLAQKVSDLENRRITYDNCESKMDYAIDLSDYLQSYEWDLLEVSANRNIKKYPCCPEPYLDVTFHIKIRRMTLFYGLNLIFPCLSISFLTIMVFYLPTYSTQKITLCISVFLALNIFILVVFDLTPKTSRSVPLIVKYLLFTMFMVTLSIVASIAVLNFSFRQPETNRLPKKLRKFFLKILPKYLKMRPLQGEENEFTPSFGKKNNRDFTDFSLFDLSWLKWNQNYSEMINARNGLNQKICRTKRKLALESLRSINRNLSLKTRINQVRNEWMYMGIVIDRLFLIIFTVFVTLGTMIIFLMPPQMWSQQIALNSKDAAILLANSNYTRLCK